MRTLLTALALSLLAAPSHAETDPRYRCGNVQPVSTYSAAWPTGSWAEPPVPVDAAPLVLPPRVEGRLDYSPDPGAPEVVLRRRDRSRVDGSLEPGAGLWRLVPAEPLAPDAEYTLEVDGQTTRFTTAAADAPAPAAPAVQLAALAVAERLVPHRSCEP